MTTPYVYTNSNIWEWADDTDVSKSLEIKKSLSPGSGQYGPTVIYDGEKPDLILSLKAKGMTRAELWALQLNVLTEGYTNSITVTDDVPSGGYPIVDGTVLGGIPTSAQGTPVTGTFYKEVSLKVHVLQIWTAATGLVLL